MKKRLSYFLFFLIFFINIFLLINQTFADTTTITYAGSISDLGGEYLWSNLNNAIGNTSSNSTSNSINTRNAYTNTISLTNFDLSNAGLPSSAIINGIELNVEWMVNGNKMRDTTVQLTKDGTNGIGDNKSNNSDGPTTKTITTYGSTSDLWGTTWTSNEILNQDFGVLLQYRNRNRSTRNVNIYKVSITIDYTKVISPGGVAGNMSIWLKSNVGTSTTTNNTQLNTWSDNSGNGFDASSGVPPTYLYDNTNNLNFYPIIDFDGTSQYLQNLNNGAYTQSYYMVIIPDQQVDGRLNGQTPLGFDCNSGILSNGTCGLNFSGLTLGYFTIAINDETITHAIGSSTGWRSAQIGSYTYENNKAMLIGVNENSSANGTDIYENGNKINNYETNTYQTISSANYSLGRSNDPSYYSYYDGKIVEVINFSSGLNDTERQKIESYLSLKYGITLNSGTSNYIASDGTTNIWSSLDAGVYNYDIFGIGRDDSSELGQIKSKSINNDSIITVEALGEGNNVNPSFYDISDLEFLSISNNNGGNFWSNIDTPSGYFSLARKWRVQENGDIGNIKMSFDVGNSNFLLPSPSLGTNYYFIYDSNNNNLLNDETPILMTNSSGNIWEITNLNINSQTIFTISSQASSNNIPSNIILSNNNKYENINIGTTIGTLSTTDIDSTDSHTYSFINGTGDDDNSFFTITNNILSINESPDYEIKNKYYIKIQTNDGNGGIFQKQFIINIMDLPEIINSVIDFETPGKYSVNSGIWSRNTSKPFQGFYSLVSDNLGIPNTQSCFQVINTLDNSGTIEFKYSVSSEANNDYLRFYIDNIEQNYWSGNIDWSTYTKNDLTSGTHTYKWCYMKNGNTDTGDDRARIDYISIKNNPEVIEVPILDFEVVGGYTVTTNITSEDWMRITSEKYEGNYSLESQNRTDNTTACFQRNETMLENDDAISFYKKVSSESGYDYLYFYIDGIEQDKWAGEIDWSKEIYNLSTGDHILKWCYKKDSSQSNGDDRARIDLVTKDTIKTALLTEITNITSPTNDNTPNYNFNSTIAGNIIYGGTCNSNQTTAIIGNNTITLNSLADGTYSDCTIQVNGSNILNISNFTIDTLPPQINFEFPTDNILYPNSDFNINLTFSDTTSGINTSTDILELKKWNGTTWGNNISPSFINLGAKTINTSGASYPITKTGFGKFNIAYNIFDNAGNSGTGNTVFYIDEPEIIINTGSLDIGDLQSSTRKFSDLEFNITVKTVGAGYNLILNKDSNLSSLGVEITNFDGNNGFGYDFDPYTSNINAININEIIATQNQNININGEKNIYNYKVKFGAKISKEQAAGDYIGNIRFGIDLNY